MIKKKEHESNDHDDNVYFGIKELENLLSDIDDDDDDYYYKPVFVKSSFKKIMNIRRAEEIRRKKKISKGISLCDYVVFSRFNK